MYVLYMCVCTTYMYVHVHVCVSPEHFKCPSPVKLVESPVILGKDLPLTYMYANSRIHMYMFSMMWHFLVCIVPLLQSERKGMYRQQGHPKPEVSNSQQPLPLKPDSQQPLPLKPPPQMPLQIEPGIVGLMHFFTWFCAIHVYMYSGTPLKGLS